MATSQIITTPIRLETMACRTPFEKIVPRRLTHLAPLRAGQALSLRSFFPIPPCVCADDPQAVQTMRGPKAGTGIASAK
jgi:hypothetical protein